MSRLCHLVSVLFTFVTNFVDHPLPQVQLCQEKNANMMLRSLMFMYYGCIKRL